jgi:hypothetical protein
MAFTIPMQEFSGSIEQLAIDGSFTLPMFFTGDPPITDPDITGALPVPMMSFAPVLDVLIADPDMTGAIDIPMLSMSASLDSEILPQITASLGIPMQALTSDMEFVPATFCTLAGETPLLQAQLTSPAHVEIAGTTPQAHGSFAVITGVAITVTATATVLTGQVEVGLPTAIDASLPLATGALEALVGIGCTVDAAAPLGQASITGSGSTSIAIEASAPLATASLTVNSGAQASLQASLLLARMSATASTGIGSSVVGVMPLLEFDAGLIRPVDATLALRLRPPGAHLVAQAGRVAA